MPRHRIETVPTFSIQTMLHLRLPRFVVHPHGADSAQDLRQDITHANMMQPGTCWKLRLVWCIVILQQVSICRHQTEMYLHEPTNVHWYRT